MRATYEFRDAKTMPTALIVVKRNAFWVFILL